MNNILLLVITIVITLTLTIYIYTHAKKTKNLALGYLISTMARYIFLLPLVLALSIKNDTILRAILLPFGNIYFYLLIFFAIGLILWIKNKKAAKYYILFSVLFLLFGGNFFIFWLPFLYLIYSFYKESKANTFKMERRKLV